MNPKNNSFAKGDKVMLNCPSIDWLHRAYATVVESDHFDTIKVSLDSNGATYYMQEHEVMLQPSPIGTPLQSALDERVARVKELNEEIDKANGEIKALRTALEIITR